MFEINVYMIIILNKYLPEQYFYWISYFGSYQLSGVSGNTHRQLLLMCDWQYHLGRVKGGGVAWLG